MFLGSKFLAFGNNQIPDILIACLWRCYPYFYLQWFYVLFHLKLRMGTLSCVLNIHSMCSQSCLCSTTFENAYMVVVHGRISFYLGTLQGMTFSAL